MIIHISFLGALFLHFGIRLLFSWLLLLGLFSGSGSLGWLFLLGRWSGE
jgi:hypothetical protein